MKFYQMLKEISCLTLIFSLIFTPATHASLGACLQAANESVKEAEFTRAELDYMGLEDLLSAKSYRLSDGGKTWGLFQCTNCGSVSATTPSKNDGRISCRTCSEPLNNEHHFFIFKQQGGQNYVPGPLAMNNLSGLARPTRIGTHWKCGSCESVNMPSEKKCTSCGSPETGKVQDFNAFAPGHIPKSILESLVQGGWKIQLANNTKIDPVRELQRLNRERERGRSQPVARTETHRPDAQARSAETRNDSRVSESVAPESRSIGSSVVTFFKSKIGKQIVAGSVSLFLVGAGLATYMTSPYKPLEGVVVERVAEMVVFENAQAYRSYMSPKVERGADGELRINRPDPANKKDGVEFFNLNERGVWVAEVGPAELAHTANSGYMVRKFHTVVEFRTEGEVHRQQFQMTEEGYRTFTEGAEVQLGFDAPFQPRPELLPEN